MILIAPTNAKINGVDIFGGRIVYGGDLESIVDERGLHFQRNQKLKEKDALHDIAIYTNVETALSPMQGVVLFVTTQQYQVVWRDLTGNYWSFVGCTVNSIVENNVHAKMIDAIEKNLEKKLGRL